VALMVAVCAVHVQLAPHWPLQTLVPLQREPHTPWVQLAVMLALALHTAQLAPQAVGSVLAWQVPPQRFIPAVQAVTTQAEAWQLVAAALAGQLAHWPLHSFAPAEQLEATQAAPEHA
jgi:hypothetical protein